jgi:hypothetical protein
LRRATGRVQGRAGLLEAARAAEANSNFTKAERLIRRALRQAGGVCPECRAALAALLEKTGRADEALKERKAALPSAGSHSD